MDECVSCLKPFTPNLDGQICDACIHEAMRHKPELYARITLVGYGSYVQPLNEIGIAMGGEFDGAETGAKWEIELIEMSKAEYEALPEFAGH